MEMNDNEKAELHEVATVNEWTMQRGTIDLPQGKELGSFQVLDNEGNVLAEHDHAYEPALQQARAGMYVAPKLPEEQMQQLEAMWDEVSAMAEDNGHMVTAEYQPRSNYTDNRGPRKVTSPAYRKKYGEMEKLILRYKEAGFDISAFANGSRP